MLWLSALIAISLTLVLPAQAQAQAERSAWSSPAIHTDLSNALNAVCADGNDGGCGVAAVLRNDHAYVYPAESPGSSVRWDAACLRAPYLDRGIVRGVPQLYQSALMSLPSTVLGTWVSADSPFRGLNIQTITLCGFTLEDVFVLDWSATEARIRFDLVSFTEASRPPLGTVASRGVFGGGLSIDRSSFDGDVRLEDGRFSSFVEIERSRFAGSFRVENTRINGSFRLRGNAFEASVRLAALVIGGDTIINGNSFTSTVDEQPREPDGTSFSIVRLRELRLGGVLEFVDNAFDAAADGRPARSLYVQKSTIGDNDVTIHRNAFAGRVYLIEVEGKKITVSQNAFGEFFEISSSDIYSFRSVNNHYLGPFSITNNRVESALIVENDIFDRDDTRLLDVRGNQVGHDLRFAPKSWPAEDYTVDFSFNDVVGPFSYFWPLMRADRRGVVSCEAPDGTFEALPARWRGELNLVGTKVATELRLVEGCLWEVDGIVAPMPEARAEELAGPSDGNAATVVDLTLVETGVLQIDLPPKGSYIWRGKGLHFDFFGDSNQGQLARVNGEAIQGQTEQTANDQLVAWLDRLERPDPEVYYAVADYLRGRGEVDRSRDWLAEGRAVDFGPTSCTGLADCVRGWVTKVILFPSNFGTQPELVVVWLAMLWVVMTLVYWLHHRASLPRHSSGDNSAPQFTMKFAGSGLGEAPAAFAGQPINNGRSTHDYATEVAGFIVHKPELEGRRFSLWLYSLDATLPVISLDHFNVFLPTRHMVRMLANVHHILGWWLVTLFFGASFF